MQKPRCDLCLEPQLFADLFAALFVQDLDRDLALEDLVGCGVDRPHTTTAQLLFEEESLVERRADTDHR